MYAIKSFHLKADISIIKLQYNTFTDPHSGTVVLHIAVRRKIVVMRRQRSVKDWKIIGSNES